jgi:hypothetical protein
LLHSSGASVYLSDVACSLRPSVRAQALAAYEDFLTLWKDADPDIPFLITAKAEYAKLQWLPVAGNSHSTSLTFHRLFAQTGSSMNACRRFWVVAGQTLPQCRLRKNCDEPFLISLSQAPDWNSAPRHVLATQQN